MHMFLRNVTANAIPPFNMMKSSTSYFAHHVANQPAYLVQISSKLLEISCTHGHTDRDAEGAKTTCPWRR